MALNWFAFDFLRLGLLPLASYCLPRARLGNTKNDLIPIRDMAIIRNQSELVGEASVYLKPAGEVVVSSFIATATKRKRMKTSPLEVICPFLGTLLNMNDLPTKTSNYTALEVFDVIVAAGVPSQIAMDMTKGNYDMFGGFPHGSMDIFDMEGNANEHVTSTGISDCHTAFGGCSGPCANWHCESDNCILPNSMLFDKFWKSCDNNTDEHLTIAEIRQCGPAIVTVDDRDNPCHSGGTLTDSMANLTSVFADSTVSKGSISKANLKKVLLERKYPPHYTFPQVRPTQPTTGTTTEAATTEAATTTEAPDGWVGNAKAEFDALDEGEQLMLIVLPVWIIGTAFCTAFLCWWYRAHLKSEERHEDVAYK